MINSFINKLKENFKIQTLFLFILMVCSLDWVIIPIPFTNSSLALMITEIIALFLLIIIFLINGKKLFEADKKFFICGISLFLYVVILFLYYFLNNSLNLEIMSFLRIYFVIAVLYLCNKVVFFNKKSIIYSIIIFVSILNLLQLIHFFTNNSLRTSEIAININIYICIVLLAIPLFFNLLDGSNKKFKIFSFLNIVITISCIIFSGSRLGFVLLLFTLLTHFLLFILFKNKKMIINLSKIILISTIFIFIMLISVANNYGKAALYRSMFIDYVFKFENDDLHKISNNNQDELVNSNNTSENINSDSNNSENKTNQDTENTGNTTPDINIENKPNQDNANVDSKKDEITDENNDNLNDSNNNDKSWNRTSDILRSALWSNASNEIKSSPIFGVGYITIEYELAGRIVSQSPHNFFLELLMVYGVVGLILYLISYGYMIFSLIKNNNIYNKFICLILIIINALFSFFQPIALSYLVNILFIFLVQIDYSKKNENI